MVSPGLSGRPLRTALDHWHRSGVPTGSLDLGTGTGALGRAFAARGGEGIGVDVSEPMLEEARRLDREAEVSVRYLVAKAEELGDGRLRRLGDVLLRRPRLIDARGLARRAQSHVGGWGQHATS